MYCLDLLVLDLECLQEEFRHMDRFGSSCLARDLRHDRFQELFPNDLRLDGFIEGARSHFHLEDKSVRFFLIEIRDLHPQSFQSPPLHAFRSP